MDKLEFYKKKLEYYVKKLLGGLPYKLCVNGCGRRATMNDSRCCEGCTGPNSLHTQLCDTIDIQQSSPQQRLQELDNSVLWLNDDRGLYRIVDGERVYFNQDNN